MSDKFYNIDNNNNIVDKLDVFHEFVRFGKRILKDVDQCVILFPFKEHIKNQDWENPTKKYHHLQKRFISMDYKIYFCSFFESVHAYGPPMLTILEKKFKIKNGKTFPLKECFKIWLYLENKHAPLCKKWKSYSKEEKMELYKEAIDARCFI
jgi:hypothetical protein